VTVTAPSFRPATELSRAFYVEVVRPLLAGRAHSAGLLGWGSDVLGYDTERSTDDDEQPERQPEPYAPDHGRSRKR